MKIIENIKKSWSEETCYPSSREEWKIENPALGQCAITALIVNDVFGGKIMRCMVGTMSHYYNFVDEEVIDLTASQFKDININYDLGEERSRDYLLSNEDTKKRYYILLKKMNDNLSVLIFESKNKQLLK